MWRQYCPLYTWCKGSTERLSETSLQLRLLMWLEHIRWQCCPRQSSPHAQSQHKPSPLQQWPPPLPEANSGHDAAPAWRNPRKCQSCGTGTERGTVLIAQLQPNIRSCKHGIESSLCQHVLGIDSPHLWNYDIILWWYIHIIHYTLGAWCHEATSPTSEAKFPNASASPHWSPSPKALRPLTWGKHRPTCFKSW